MKKTICFYFQVHQPYRLKRYRFFNIGKDHFYYDDFLNKSILKKVAEKCYLPTNQLMLDLIKKYGKQFKITYSLSGIFIEQIEKYAPEVLESFIKLAKTGCVEFLGETYSHSLASLQSGDEFEQQVKMQNDMIEKYFGKRPSVFRNTELIYSDEIGARVEKMGFKAMLAEGAKQVLGWRSPNMLYTNAIEPKLKVMLRNYSMSDDIAFRFSDRNWAQWPLTAEKYAQWLDEVDDNEEIINLYMDYETFGEHQNKDTGIFDFMRELPHQILKNGKYEFLTPSEIIKKHQPVSPVHVEYPTSWADEERDLSAWLGNELQNEAYSKAYSLADKVMSTNNADLIKTWRALQTSDHFYYMCTKWFSDGDVHSYFNPYDTPYEAFINYMNVLSDFEILVNEAEKNPQKQVKVKKTSVKEAAKKAVKPAAKAATKTVKAKVAKKAEVKTKKVAKAAKPAVKKTVKPAAKAATKTVKAKVAKKAEVKTKKVAKATKPAAKKVTAKTKTGKNKK